MAVECSLGSAEVIARLPFEETASNSRASPPGDHFPRLITLLCSFECCRCNEPAPEVEGEARDEVDALSAPTFLRAALCLPRDVWVDDPRDDEGVLRDPPKFLERLLGKRKIFGTYQYVPSGSLKGGLD